jgi:superfamily II DNA or RNA helicase
MPSNDIIDNRDQKLADHINQILGSTDAAKFALGYFFLSGLEAVAKNLEGVTSLRLLIGNTTNRETIEQVAEGYQRLELVAAAEEKERYLKRGEQKQRAEETAANLRHTIERMDQTDESQALVQTVVRMIQEKRLQVRVFTKGRLHAKAYIFDYRNDGRYEKGIAIVGSSNLTLSGLTHNTELNVVVHGNDNHAKLSEWFEGLWAEAQDFEALLMEELSQSWPAATATPYDIYMKSLYALVADRLDEGERGEILWDDDLTRDLADFQKTAVRQAVQMIRDHGGAFVSDVVGLGKSYIGAAVLKHFVRTQGAKPLIICPKPLEEMWQHYDDRYSLDTKILPMSLLKLPDQEGVKSVLESKAYKDRDFVLIDESHNFRHHSSQRYEVLADFLAKGQKKVCLVTATPRNRGAGDVYNQIKLFHQDDITHLPIDPPNLKDYFKMIEKGEKRLQDLLVHILIRRTRKHILRWYGYGADTTQPLRELSDVKVRPYLIGEKKAYVMVGGRHQYFPTRELETLRYSIEETYKGLYDDIRSCLGRPAGEKGKAKPGKELVYARYGLWNYVRPEKQKVAPYNDLHRAGINLRGLIRVMLFKRFESSVYAFRKSLERLDKIHGYFLESLDMGFVPAGDDAQKLLYESDVYDDEGLMDALYKCSGRYQIRDFNEALLREHLEADHQLIHKMLKLVEPISPDKDAKLQVLLAGLKRGIPKVRGKVLIFSQYADTTQYLYENINPDGKRKDVESIYGTEKSKARMAARFSPLSNPHIELRPGEEVSILVATDVMSEGLNLQDGDVVVNYDLHWNPVRLIQRFGRIDRIGTENEQVWGYNFLPEDALDKNLGLHDVLHRRIQEIHDTIGEDAAILDKEEQINEEAMFAIYEKRGGQLTMFEEEEGEFLDISEAEELMRTLRASEPEEFKRIAALRDGIRSASGVFSGVGRYVFCQAGKYQQLMMADPEGGVISRDVPIVLGRVKCSKTEPAAALPGDHNEAVMNVLRLFIEEVKHRRAQQQHSLSLSAAQSYALRELHAFYSRLEDEETDLKSQVVKLEEAFKRPVTAAIRRQLNTLRRNGVVGSPLVRSLTDIYHDHGLHEQVYEDRRLHEQEAENFPRIICSEAFI